MLVLFLIFKLQLGKYCSLKYWIRLAHHSTPDCNTQEYFVGEANDLPHYAFLKKYASQLFSVPFNYFVYSLFHLKLLYFLYIVNLYRHTIENFHLFHPLSK